jgi:predicted thioesterase
MGVQATKDLVDHGVAVCRPIIKRYKDDGNISVLGTETTAWLSKHIPVTSISNFLDSHET